MIGRKYQADVEPPDDRGSHTITDTRPDAFAYQIARAIENYLPMPGDKAEEVFDVEVKIKRRSL